MQLHNTMSIKPTHQYNYDSR